MSWKYFDYECNTCGAFEELVNGDDSEVLCKNDPSHGLCPRVASSPLLSFVGLGDDAARRKESLLKRSREHSMKEMQHNAEKFGMKSKGPGAWNARKRGR